MSVCALQLQFKSDPTGPAFDLVSRLPIVIGTVPLRAGQHTYAIGDGLLRSDDDKLLMKNHEGANELAITVENSDTRK